MLYVFTGWKPGLPCPDQNSSGCQRAIPALGFFDFWLTIGSNIGSLQLNMLISAHNRICFDGSLQNCFSTEALHERIEPITFILFTLKKNFQILSWIRIYYKTNQRCLKFKKNPVACIVSPVFLRCEKEGMNSLV